MEPKALLLYRISYQQVTRLKKQECIRQSVLIQKDIVEYLIACAPHPMKPEIEKLYQQLCKFETAGKITFKSISAIFYELLQHNLHG